MRRRILGQTSDLLRWTVGKTHGRYIFYDKMVDFKLRRRMGLRLAKTSANALAEEGVHSKKLSQKVLSNRLKPCPFLQSACGKRRGLNSFTLLTHSI